MGRSQLSKISALSKENKRLEKILTEPQLDERKLGLLKAEGLTIDELCQAVISTCQKLNTS